MKMKSVMLSVQPKWCGLIANGEKTIEVRKSIPKLETPFKCYIYCTKSGRPLVFGQSDPYAPDKYQQTYGYSKECAEEIFGIMNGKVIGEFTCYWISEFFVWDDKASNDSIFELQNLEKSCIPFDSITEYIGENRWGYSWNITDLKIYDQPKQLSDFTPYGYATKFGGKKTFKRPPQSWCYVES